MNIFNNTDRAALIAKGFKYALTLPRGENKGRIISKHKTIEAADRAAKGRELQISDLSVERL